MGTFTQDVTVFVTSLGPDASKALAQQARETKETIVREQTARRGIAPGVQSAVDGRLGENYEQVKPDGAIVQVYDYRPEIVAACFEELRARSPTGPVEGGHYRDEHFAMLDGRGLSPLTVPKAADLANVSRVTVTNPMPYSRKLEVGVTKSGRSFVANVDPHIFESAMTHVRREFSAVAKITFGFVDLSGAYTLRQAGGRRGRGIGSSIRYPAIFIDRH